MARKRKRKLPLHWPFYLEEPFQVDLLQRFYSTELLASPPKLPKKERSNEREKERARLPTNMSQNSLSQNKEAQLRSYQVRLKDNIRSMFDNFTEIIKLARIEEDGQLLRPTQIDQDHYEMQVRAANIVKAGESLMKLVSDLKQFLILNDFPSVNDSITYNAGLYKDIQAGIDKKLMMLRDEMASDLYELEDEYYSSVYK